MWDYVKASAEEKYDRLCDWLERDMGTTVGPAEVERGVHVTPEGDVPAIWVGLPGGADGIDVSLADGELPVVLDWFTGDSFTCYGESDLYALIERFMREGADE